MSEESYELQLVGEGLNIISVPLLPRDTLEPPTDEADNNAMVTNDEGSSVKTENTWINDMLANLKVGIIRNNYITECNSKNNISGCRQPCDGLPSLLL